MKAKKTAFANTSTGYGRNKHSGLSKGKNAKGENGKADGKDGGKDAKADKDKLTLEPKEEQDKDLNSGFGDYLRTPEAFEMMKLFVFANTVMLIVTMAWPHVKEQFYMLNQWWESFNEQ